MNFGALCQTLYRTHVLKNIKKEGDVAKFLISSSIPDDAIEMLPLGNDSYMKWYRDVNVPKKAVWEKFDEEKCYQALLDSFCDEHLRELASDLGISPELPVIKKDLARAIAGQLSVIAEHNGRTDINVIKKLYLDDAFALYLAKYEKAFSMTKTVLAEREHPFYDFFVCNKLSSLPPHNAEFGSYLQVKDLNGADLDMLHRVYSNRILLIGRIGAGKTMMLHHFILQSLRSGSKKIPVLADLSMYRFNQDKPIDYLLSTLKRFDEEITKEQVVAALKQGRFQILMDGLERVGSEDIRRFESDLSGFMLEYPGNQYVITARDCGVQHTFTSFSALHVYPFSKEQSFELANRILSDAEPKVREKVLGLMNTEELDEHMTLISNPMLLTFLIMKSPLDYDKHIHMICRAIYDWLAEYYSIELPEKFTEEFELFCYDSYIAGKSSFDHATFEKIYNGKELSVKEFLHAACSSVGVMYEHEMGIYYLHIIFQEYFFALHCMKIDEEELHKVGRSFWEKQIGGGGFRMLLEMDKEKMEKDIFLPYLDAVFQEEDTFYSFLKYGFMEIKSGVQNRPASVLLSVILKMLGCEDEFSFEDDGNYTVDLCDDRQDVSFVVEKLKGKSVYNDYVEVLKYYDYLKKTYRRRNPFER